MRRTITAVAVVLAVGMTATAAMAASPHFKKDGEPVCTISGWVRGEQVDDLYGHTLGPRGRRPQHHHEG